MNTPIGTKTTSTSDDHQLAWGPVIAGAIIALGSEVLVNFLGLGLGLTRLDQSAAAMSSVGTGTVIWLSLTGILTMFYGGWACGRLLTTNCKIAQTLHGVLAWSLATLVTVAVSTTTLGIMIGGPNNIAKTTISQLGHHSITASARPEDANRAAATQTENSSEPNPDEATSQVGGASFSLFAAFLLSALASVSGVMFGRRQSAS